MIFGIGTGNILAATFLLFHWLRKNTKISDLLLFPSCLIFAYLPSFAIFNYSLGDTQAQFLYALQAIEWTGIEGLTWLIGLANILAYNSFLIEKICKKNRCFFLHSSLLFGLVGEFMPKICTPKSQKKIAQWQTKKVALVQPNREASLFYQHPPEGFSKNCFSNKA